jgi:CRP/FNR family transcriptional regulator, cyclic AMP receptor protein
MMMRRGQHRRLADEPPPFVEPMTGPGGELPQPGSSPDQHRLQGTTRAADGVAADAMPSRHELAELLSAVSLFARSTRHELATVARHLETATFPAGTELIKEGAKGDALFFMLRGEASIRRGDHEVATVGPGSYFGELALLDGKPCSATVLAVDPVTVAVLGVRMFRILLAEYPDLALALLGQLADEVRQARVIADATTEPLAGDQLGRVDDTSAGA